MTFEERAPLTDQDLAAIRDAGAGWCSEALFARLCDELAVKRHAEQRVRELEAQLVEHRQTEQRGVEYQYQLEAHIAELEARIAKAYDIGKRHLDMFTGYVERHQSAPEVPDSHSS